jgi:hypothetical protein
MFRLSAVVFFGEWQAKERQIKKSDPMNKFFISKITKAIDNQS